MTKSDLIEKVAAQLNLPKGKAELIINCIFDSMEEALKQGQRIEIRGFGSFEIRKYKAYEGRNPRTGDPVGVNPKRLPFFKVGKELKERVNAGAEPVPVRVSAPAKEPAKEPAAKEPVKEPREPAGTSKDGAGRDGKAAVASKPASPAPVVTPAVVSAPAAPAAAGATSVPGATTAGPAGAGAKKKSSGKPRS
ncbi:MAG: HU family DNA-binding protein [Polyangia bacterium]